MIIFIRDERRACQQQIYCLQILSIDYIDVPSLRPAYRCTNASRGYKVGAQTDMVFFFFYVDAKCEEPVGTEYGSMAHDTLQDRCIHFGLAHTPAKMESGNKEQN